MGEVEWRKTIESDMVTLPEDETQLPDIFIYLNNGDVSASNTGDGSNICYRRLKARSLMYDRDGNDWVGGSSLSAGFGFHRARVDLILCVAPSELLSQ